MTLEPDVLAVRSANAREVEPREPRPRRREIEGLRTIAALLVASYHVWFGKVSGGVDVFFVVTGFLITLTLVSQVRTHGRVRPLAYVGRLARRVWPAAGIVLVAALALTATIAPAALRSRNLAEVLASASYVENWFLAANAIDYLNREDPHSPVQHFWAMSLQGQFYLLWMVIAIVAAAISARRAAGFGRTFAILIAAISVASFAWSLWQTSVQQPVAYFSTLTRIWEFGVGGLLALAGGRVVLRGGAAAIASWVGLAGLVACGLVLPVAGVFPGWAALWPVACAAVLLMASRDRERSWAATRVLSWTPLVWLGGVAFGIYLWHWPLLIGYRYLRGDDATPGLITGIAIIAAAIALAVVTNLLVERRVTRGWATGPRARRTVAVALVALWVGITATAAWGVGRAAADAASLDRSAQVAASRLGGCFGASALRDEDGCGDALEDVALTPERSSLLSDTGGAYGCYTTAEADRLHVCSYGSGPTRVALIGNSHAAMFGPRLGERADGLGWTLDVMVGNGCVWNTQRPGEPDVSERCAPRIADAETRLFDDPYDLVIFAGGRGSESAAPDEISRIAGNWRDLQAAGSRIAVIEDNPRIGEVGAACVRASEDSALRDGACDIERATATAVLDRFAAAADLTDDVTVVPMLDQYCDATVCPAVVGGVIVYRDAHHVTGTYTRTTIDVLLQRLAAAG